MEFIITTDLTAIPERIEFNAQELRAELEPKLAHYNNLVVTADSIKAAKEDKAKLNALLSAAEDTRKRLKKQCMAPYEEFEKEYKQIYELIKAPIDSIDGQINVFKEQYKQEKYAAIQQHFESAMEECGFGENAVVLDKILNPKWANTTMKLDSIKAEITETLQQIMSDALEIGRLYQDVPCFAAIMDRFFEHYDKGQALAYAVTLTQQEQKVQSPSPAKQPEAAKPPAAQPVHTQEKTHTGAFRVFGTKSQIAAIGSYMRQIGVKYEIIKETKKEDKNNDSK